MQFTINALNKIRNRVSMYIGSKSIKAIFVYVVGIECVQSNNWTDNRHIDYFHQQFQHWVMAKYPDHLATHNWASILLEQVGGDDEQAVDLFYQLLDEFVAQR